MYRTGLYIVAPRAAGKSGPASCPSGVSAVSPAIVSGTTGRDVHPPPVLVHRDSLRRNAFPGTIHAGTKVRAGCQRLTWMRVKPLVVWLIAIHNCPSNGCGLIRYQSQSAMGGRFVTTRRRSSVRLPFEQRAPLIRQATEEIQPVVQEGKRVRFDKTAGRLQWNDLISDRSGSRD